MSTSPPEAPKSVLVVEDDPLIREIFLTILEHAGYRTTGVADGKAGLMSADASPPDLLVLDIGLPGIDGWEVLDRLRERPRTRDIPVLIVTASLVDEALERAEREGCAGYLLKPVTPQELVDEVQGCIGDP